MSTPRPAPLPQRCQVLVVGAGPAGCAAARQLASQGWDVVMVDQHPLGRDKVCGDGLIPDAHRALQRLGLLERVMAQAQRSAHVACVGPRGGRLEVPGHLAVLPRRQLDALLNLAAQEAGARFLAPARFESPLLDGQQRVCGARLLIEGQGHEIQADWVLLATGAVPKALSAAGLCQRHTPSGVALRGYLRAPALAQEFKTLDVVWCKPVRPGYGWIFPAPDGVFNIGIGVTDSHEALAGKGLKKDLNLREMFERFVTHYPPAARLVAQGEWVGELKGAPLRCTLTGAAWTRPGLMVIGEAAGSTYAFTGEGIGKAMQTALLAVDALLAHPHSDGAARQAYEHSLRALQPQYRLYERADRIHRFPWLADLLIWRAQRSPRLLHRISGVLEETHNPGQLVTLRGLARLFTE